jgi:aminomethyltransferase
MRSIHDSHGARYREVGDRRVVDHYGRPERTVRAVRNVVGFTEAPYDVLVVEGDRLPDATVDPDSLALDDGATGLVVTEGLVDTDLVVYRGEGRLLCLVGPGRAPTLVERWPGARDATDEFVVFGVHGPKATEKLASVLTGPPPADRLSLDRDSLDDHGVTVARTDDPAGEEGYELLCAPAAAERVFELLLAYGLNAVPFGYRTWETLTLEAGTPVWPADLDGRSPAVLDAARSADDTSDASDGDTHTAADHERLVALRSSEPLSPGDPVRVDGDRVGTVTRGAESPTAGHLAFAVLAGDHDAVSVDGAEATVARLPFVDGSARSGRCLVPE